MENNLPKNWVETELGEFSNVVSGNGFPKKYQGKLKGDFPFYKVRDISQTFLRREDYLTKANNYINENEIEEIKGKIIPKGTIVFAKIGEALRLNRRAILSTPSLCDNNVMGVIPAKYEFHKFIYYFLNTQDLGIYSAGNAVPSIRKSILENLKIPLPPLAEQKRIVAKLDLIFSNIDNLKTRLEKIPELLKNFRQAVLTQAVTGKLTEEWRVGKDLEEWKEVKIDSLVRSLKTDIRTGPFGSALKKYEHQPSGVPVWGIESIGREGKFTGKNKIFITNKKAGELKSFEVKGGNLIISRSGTVGEICILPDDVEYGLISTNLLKIVLNNEVVVSKYFVWMFTGSQEIKDKLVELCKGSTRLFITQTILKQLFFMVPNLEEQAEIVSRVENLFSKADNIEKAYNTLKAKTDTLPQAILAKAFKGELVEQLDTDGNAKELLEEILKLKEEMEKGNKTKKKK